MHAVTPGNLAACHGNASFAAADDNRLIAERGIVAFLDRRVERIAIDVCDCEPFEFFVID